MNSGHHLVNMYYATYTGPEVKFPLQSQETHIKALCEIPVSCTVAHSSVCGRSCCHHRLLGWAQLSFSLSPTAINTFTLRLLAADFIFQHHPTSVTDCRRRNKHTNDTR